MSILLFGVNHRSAPLDLRERLVVSEKDLPGEVGRLASAEAVDEGFILSTCNRTELLAHVTAPRGEETLRRFLVGRGSVTADELAQHAYLHAGPDAVRHLFRVAASLDSMIVGEPQILGQVKEAYAAAHAAGAARTVLDGLLQRAFAVAKRVRTETGIARAPVSIAHAAAARAREIFGDLERSAVLILGAGKMARLAAQHIASGGARTITVVNRSYQRGLELAQELKGEARSWDNLPDEMRRADVVIVSTGAPHHVVTKDDVAEVARARRGRPIFFVDIALPRNVDPRVNDLDNVYLYDLDDLKGVAEAGLRERREEAELAESIVESETAAYVDWVRSLDVAPLIVELREHLHAVGTTELERFRGRLGALTPQQEAALEEFRTALLNKILHHPIQALMRDAQRPEPRSLAAMLRELFGLDGRGPSRGGRP